MSLIVYETKECTRCGCDLRMSMFYRDRSSTRPDCKDCVKARVARWKAENSERKRSADRARYRSDPEKVKRRTRRWVVANPAKRSEIAKRWRDGNRDAHRAMKESWRKRNPGRVNAAKAARRAAEIRATPAWADREAIRKIYEAAHSVGMQVDHIIPLRGKYVSGLHVPENLQLLPPVDNIRKSNRFEIN